MARRSDRDRRPYVIDRRLFGPHTCRVGLCGKDGTHGVALPGITTIGEKVWTTVYFCEKHADEHIARLSK